MDFSFSPEHDELRAVVRSFLASRSSESEVRRLMADEAGHDPDVCGPLLASTALATTAIFGEC